MRESKSDLELVMLKYKEKIRSLEIENQNLEHKASVNENLVNIFFDNISDFALIEDRNLNLLRVSSSLISKTETDYKYWENKNLREIYPSSNEEFFKNNKSVLENKKPVFNLDETMHVSGKKIKTRSNLHPVEYGDNYSNSVLNISKDRTISLKLAEAYEKLSKEKIIPQKNEENFENLLNREVHHRIKNNLNSVKSFLALQRAELKDKNLQKYFIEAESRILTCSLLHERLYSAIDTCDLYSYLVDISDKSLKIHNNPKIEIVHKKICKENLKLKQDKMLSFGLIVNELITNTIKHSVCCSKISIALENQNGYLKLIYTDNGKADKNPNFENSKEFGLWLIKAFAEKLKADIEFSLNENFYFELTLKSESLH